MNERVRQHMLEEMERKRRFGEVRPLITTVHKGHRFIVVGSRVYFHQGWRTFTDFLFFYIQDVFGKDWWVAEQTKTSIEQHPVVRWQAHVLELTKTLERDEDGFYSAVPDGIMSAFLLLAYDLYVLRDHAKLQEDVLQRLRHRDQFQGARYELFVAATFIRAGFDFAYEDESDTKKKHAEFVATHQESGLIIAVEAKARHRTMRQPFDMASIRPGVKQLLVNAAEKQPAHPLVGYVELNLPPEDARQPPSWIPQVQHVVEEIAAEEGGRSPFGAVFFTNRPHVYGLPGEPDPSRHVYAAWPSGSPIPDEIIELLGDATQKYGNVPSRFPPEWGSDSATASL